MRWTGLFAAALSTACVFGTASAETEVQLPRFEAIELQGGGHVILRHGARQKVSIVQGDPNVTRLNVERRSLRISACDGSCPAGYRLVVEVVAPSVSAIAVTGGGSVEAKAGFPGRSSHALAVQGGGTIDTQALDVRQVAASVDGGGTIRTRASGNLAASVRGGGLVTYLGDPSVATSVKGGGSVQPASGR